MVTEIRRVFWEYLKSLLETNKEVILFDSNKLYLDSRPVQGLCGPLSEQEVAAAVYGLAENKASGPDDLPHEFV